MTDHDHPPLDDPARRRARSRLGMGAVVVLLLGAFALVVAIGMIRGATGAEIVDVSPPSSTAMAEPAAGLFVHVTGAVHSAGLYRLDAGARVVDAVAAAGGFTDDADRAGVNLARPVADGEQLVVPVLGATPPGESGSGAAGAASGAGAGAAIDLNTATIADLDTLPRIGPALAERIVAWRQENGRFTSVDDLLSVPGIGEKMLDGLRDRVRV